jgi:hypothetical protein
MAMRHFPLNVPFGVVINEAAHEKTHKDKGQLSVTQ